MIRNSLAIGAVAVIPGLACGTSDSEVFASASTTEAAATTAPTTTAAPATTTAETTATTAGEAEVASAGPALPTGAEMVVSFTYSPTSAGKNVPPYVAVWLEDADDNLVATIELWRKQSNNGTRWLSDLRRWFSANTAFVAAGGTDAVSSATRLAGSYSVAWDGMVDGSPIPAGDYYVCIESAREHGPYSLIREALTLDGNVVMADLPDSEELVSADVSVA